MKYDFDNYTERRGTDSCKWNGFENMFPGYDASGAIPMWVADMDFPAPAEVVEAVTERAAQGIYGYPCFKGAGFDNAVCGWLEKRHGWKIENNWIVATSGVVPAVTYAVQAFTDEGDGIMIQTPVYYPFKDSCIGKNGRVAVENRLKAVRDAGGHRHYEIDFDDFRKKASDPSVKMFILCSPHNPVGRVWTEDELEKMIRICQENGVLVFSDEIHSDLIMRGWKHVPAGKISTEGLIAAYAPSKTFNLAGIRVSAIIIPDRELRHRYRAQMEKNQAAGLNVFADAALQAAYGKGGEYLEQLLDYLGGNMEYARGYIEKNIPDVYAYVTEGTYFLWLDFNGTGLSEDDIYRKVLEEAKVAGDLGGWFGSGGEGFVRLNCACPRVILEEALRRIEKVFGNM